MNEITNIWNTLVQSNTFNFIVMVLILGYIFKKINFISILDNVKDNIVSVIEKSKEEKLKAAKELELANELVKNLDNEINEQLNEAQEQAKALSKNIDEETEAKVNNIRKNIERATVTEEKTISARLLNKTAIKALESAKNKISEILKTSPELHDKYIQESIYELDRIEI